MLYGLVRTCVIIRHNRIRNLRETARLSPDPTRTRSRNNSDDRPPDSMYQIVPGVGRGQSRFK